VASFIPGAVCTKSWQGHRLRGTENGQSERTLHHSNGALNAGASKKDQSDPIAD